MADREYEASVRNARVSFRKAVRTLRPIRNKKYREAVQALVFVNTKSARIVEKLLKSCYSNGMQQNPNLREDALYIKEITVVPGLSIRRLSPRAQGRADVIKKRSAHFFVKLVEKD